MTVKLDSRQVVKRISASSNQHDDSLESSSGRGDLYGRQRSQSERAKAGDECKIERLVLLVVWDIQECGLLPSALAHHAPSLRSGRVASRLRTNLPLSFGLQGRCWLRLLPVFPEDLV